MPRPADNYTHSQFELVDSEHSGETVQCVHCRNWTGSVKTLHRKKEHLLKCAAYARWREEGHGQELAPPNTYNKRVANFGSADEAGHSSPYQSHHSGPCGPQYTPTMNAASRFRHTDLTKLFDEFWDDSSAQKCMRVRCLHCGFVRAKNTTRQVEHLLQCKEYQDSEEGHQAMANGEPRMPPPQAPMSAQSTQQPGESSIWRGARPNPNLVVQRKQSRPSGIGQSTSTRGPPPRPVPSLVKHLSRDHSAFQSATQQPFLSHAGCGTLSSAPLLQWLAQESYISRGFISFIGALIGKIRLPETKNSQLNTTYRAMDLLISALNNVRREMSFFEETQRKYNLFGGSEEVKPAAKAYVDLFTSASAPGASLLEGLVLLWATEHCYRTSWQYAATFTSTVPSSTYSLPSYLQPGGGIQSFDNPYAPPPTNNPDTAHVAALQQHFIPNWTSPAFSKFVDACMSIVDELANAQTSGNGREEMQRCESVFRQVVWLWERLWPEVNGMGQEDELADELMRHANSTQTPPAPPGNGVYGAGPSSARMNGGGSGGRAPVEIDDDDDDSREVPDESVDSPYAGTGLGAVAAANQS